MRVLIARDLLAMRQRERYATDATHIWANAYERDCADNLSVQTDVAQLIAEAVASRLLGFD